MGRPEADKRSVAVWGGSIRGGSGGIRGGGGCDPPLNIGVDCLPRKASFEFLAILTRLQNLLTEFNHCYLLATLDFCAGVEGWSAARNFSNIP